MAGHKSYMPLYWGDYLGDTMHLTRDEHGAYLLLMAHYWMRGSLPDDDARLASIAKATPEEWEGIKPVIAEFFGPGWTHARIERERAQAEEKYEKRRNAGKKGGEAKAANKQSASKPPSNAKANDVAKRYQPEPEPEDISGGVRARAREAPPDDGGYGESLDELMDAAGKAINATRPMIQVISEPMRWRDELGLDWRSEVLPTVRAVSGTAPPGSIQSWAYFSRPMADLAAAKTRKLPEGRAYAEPYHAARTAPPSRNAAALAALAAVSGIGDGS